MRLSLCFLLSLALLGSLGCDSSGYANPPMAGSGPAPYSAPVNQPADQGYFRTLVQDFITERHPELTVQGFNFTDVNSNLWIVGAQVQDRNTQQAYRKDFKVECFQDLQGQTMWQVDYATNQTLQEAVQRQGLQAQVNQLNQTTYLQNLMMWSYLMGRPEPVWYGYNDYSAYHYSGYGYYGFTPRPEYRTRYVTVIHQSTTIVNHIHPAPIAQAPTSGRAYVGTKSGYVKSDMGTVKSNPQGGLQGFKMQTQRPQAPTPSQKAYQSGSTGYRGTQGAQNAPPSPSSFRMAPSSPSRSSSSSSGRRR